MNETWKETAKKEYWEAWSNGSRTAEEMLNAMIETTGKLIKQELQANNQKAEETGSIETDGSGRINGEVYLGNKDFCIDEFVKSTDQSTSCEFDSSKLIKGGLPRPDKNAVVGMPKEKPKKRTYVCDVCKAIDRICKIKLSYRDSKPRCCIYDGEFVNKNKVNWKLKNVQDY